MALIVGWGGGGGYFHGADHDEAGLEGEECIVSRERNLEEAVACMTGLVMLREKKRRGDGRIWESRREVGQGSI